jgi:dimethylaniline monooxygenase (N-oxide forming)
MASPTTDAATVAVIGLGAHGLVALKNLLEEGFNATGFDSNTYVGGLWHYTAAAEVSCLQTTHVNVSRERACFTDFAFPDGQ